MATAYHESIDIGRVMQRGFSVIGRNAGGFLLAAVVLAGVPNFLLQYLASPENLLTASPGAVTPESPVALVALFLGLMLFTLFGSGLLQAAVVRSTILDLNGRPADIGGSLQTSLSLVLPVLGLTIVSAFGMGLAFLLLIVPGLIVMCMWFVAVPVLVEERLGILASLSRSSELTSGSRWQVFGLIVVLWILGMIVAAVFAFFPVMAAPENYFLIAFFQAVAATVSGVFGAAMAASLYVELREVKEGATPDSLAAIFE
jgi:MFS family permease